MNNQSFNYNSAIAEGLFILTNNLYLGIVLSTSVSKPFRKPFYTNPFYTLNVIILWCFNTLLVLLPNLSNSDLHSSDNSEEAEFIRVLALVVGNLVMVVMYFYENLLVFIWEVKRNWKKKSPGDELAMQEGRDILN